jgi:hypothetical protein
VTRMSGFLGQSLKNSAQLRWVIRQVRILLNWTIWATFLPSSGCVVPVAPEFQNPSAAPNYGPYFVDTDPFAETQAIAGQDFTVRVADPNPGDVLYVRWASDYPPFVQTRSKLLVDGATLAATGGPRPTHYATRDSNGVDCRDFTQFPPGADHKLVVIVSDRPFVPPAEVSTNRVDRYNAVQGDANFTFPPLMAAWTVQQCPPP